jgi:hypothetical protein
MAAWAAGDGTCSSATEGVSAGADLSGGVECSMTASNESATPPGSAIHPPLRKAETIGSRNCLTREVGWEGDGSSGALPCHSHKPDPWFPSLGDVVSDSTIACPPKCGGDSRATCPAPSLYVGLDRTGARALAFDLLNKRISSVCRFGATSSGFGVGAVSNGHGNLCGSTTCTGAALDGAAFVWLATGLTCRLMAYSRRIPSRGQCDDHPGPRLGSSILAV